MRSVELRPARMAMAMASMRRSTPSAPTACARDKPVGAHVHEDMHRLSTGEIARMLVRVRVHREVLRARGVEGLGGERLC